MLMRFYLHDNVQVNKDYTKKSSRNFFNLLNVIPLFEAMIFIVHSYFCLRPTSFLCHKGTAKMSNSMKENFIFDSAFGW